MSPKRIYDRKHTSLHLRKGDFAYLRLHKGYEIPSAWNRKLGDQYADPFEVIEKKVGRLADRMKLPTRWYIHPVFSVAHLEPAEDSTKDPYRRPNPDQPEATYVDGDTPAKQSYELERLLDHRVRVVRGRTVVECLARWKGQGAKYDKWLKLEELDNAADLVKDYHESKSPASMPASALRLLGKFPTSDSPQSVRQTKPATAVTTPNAAVAANTTSKLSSTIPKRPGRPTKEQEVDATAG